MKELVIVTGASSGIGRELARRFSAEGHPVLMLARRREIMEEMHLPHTMCRSVDVTDLSAMEAAVREAEAAWGPAGLLVNCAGLMLLGHPESQDFEEWSRMIDVNVKGVLAGVKSVLAGMMDRRSGTVINISSTAGRKTYVNHSVYCGTKFAVHAMTESLRKEAASHNVRFITIAPGVVETALLSHTSDEAIKKDYNVWKESIHGGLSPSQVADCILFAYRMPQDVCVREIVIAKTAQED